MRHIRNLYALQVWVDTSGIFPASGDSPSLSERGNLACLFCVLSGVVVGAVELVDGITQFDITKEKQTFATTVVAAAVVGGFAGHVGEVYTLSEHVSGDRSFGGCDAETLTEDTTVVGTAGTVPE